MSSTYGDNLDTRMLDTSLYVVDNSDITSIVTTSYFTTLLINMYNDLPLLRQFFPTPDRINKFMDLTYCQKSRAKAG
jgi:hypothetical protein